MTLRTAFCFDLDNTITRREILPALAHELDLSEDMALLTRLTMDGAVPFEASFRLRCEILKQIPLERARSIVAEVPVEAAIVGFISARPQDCFVITGNLDVWVEGLVGGFGCRFFSSRGACADGHLLRVQQIVDKAAALREVRALGYDRVVAVGDGMNDAAMLETADVSIAYGAVRPPAAPAIAQSDYVVYSDEALCRLLRTL